MYLYNSATVVAKGDSSYRCYSTHCCGGVTQSRGRVVVGEGGWL